MLQPVASTVPVTVATGLMSAAVMLMPSRMNPVALQVVVALVCVPKSIAKASEVAHPKSNRLILPPSNCQLPNFQVHRNLSIGRRVCGGLQRDAVLQELSRLCRGPWLPAGPK